jgi:hypothetical protein
LFEERKQASRMLTEERAFLSTFISANSVYVNAVVKHSHTCHANACFPLTLLRKMKLYNSAPAEMNVDYLATLPAFGGITYMPVVNQEFESLTLDQCMVTLGRQIILSDDRNLVCYRCHRSNDNDSSIYYENPWDRIPAVAVALQEHGENNPFLMRDKLICADCLTNAINYWLLPHLKDMKNRQSLVTLSCLHCSLLNAGNEQTKTFHDVLADTLLTRLILDGSVFIHQAIEVATSVSYKSPLSNLHRSSYMLSTHINPFLDLFIDGEVVHYVSPEKLKRKSWHEVNYLEGRIVHRGPIPTTIGLSNAYNQNMIWTNSMGRMEHPCMRRASFMIPNKFVTNHIPAN